MQRAYVLPTYFIGYFREKTFGPPVTIKNIEHDEDATVHSNFARRHKLVPFLPKSDVTSPSTELWSPLLCQCLYICKTKNTCPLPIFWKSDESNRRLFFYLPYYDVRPVLASYGCNLFSGGFSKIYFWQLQPQQKTSFLSDDHLNMGQLI